MDEEAKRHCSRNFCCAILPDLFRGTFSLPRVDDKTHDAGVAAFQTSRRSFPHNTGSHHHFVFSPVNYFIWRIHLLLQEKDFRAQARRETHSFQWKKNYGSADIASYPGPG